MNGVPYLLLVLVDHGAFTNGGLHHEALRGSFCGSTEGCGTLGPAARLYAEDGEIDGVRFDWNDAVFGNDAVLLAAGDDFSGEEQEWLAGVVNEDERVDLITMEAQPGKWRIGTACAGTDETLDTARFGDLDFAAADSLVEGDERRFAGGFAGNADDRKQEKVAALNWSEHTVRTAGRFNGASGVDRFALFVYCQCEYECYGQTDTA